MSFVSNLGVSLQDENLDVSDNLLQDGMFDKKLDTSKDVSNLGSSLHKKSSELCNLGNSLYMYKETTTSYVSDVLAEQSCSFSSEVHANARQKQSNLGDSLLDDDEQRDHPQFLGLQAVSSSTPTS